MPILHLPIFEYLSWVGIKVGNWYFEKSQDVSNWATGYLHIQIFAFDVTDTYEDAQHRHGWRSSDGCLRQTSSTNMHLIVSHNPNISQLDFKNKGGFIYYLEI